MLLFFFLVISPQRLNLLNHPGGSQQHANLAWRRQVFWCVCGNKVISETVSPTRFKERLTLYLQRNAGEEDSCAMFGTHVGKGKGKRGLRRGESGVGGGEGKGTL